MALSQLSDRPFDSICNYIMVRTGHNKLCSTIIIQSHVFISL